MSEIKGICTKCGARYYGWALANPAKQKCERCGSELEIAESGAHIRTSYSSSTTRTYKTVFNHKRSNDGSTIID
jgi:transcription initiation factor IIE alpha subunit